MILPIIAAAAATTVQPTPADINDLRCVAAFAAVSNFAKTEDEKTKLIAGLLYFIGKIDGRATGIDMNVELTALLKQPDYFTKQFGPDVERCAEEAKVRGKALEDLGDAMKKAG